MAKACTLCTSPQSIQDRIETMEKENLSLKKMEAILGKEHNFKISSSSIGRHLKECLHKRADPEPIKTDVLDRLTQNPTDNEILNEMLQTTLAQAALQCHQQILDKPDLESFRSLEVLVNIRDKLYGETKVTESRPSELRELAYKTIAEFREALEEQEERRL
jgi:hypothetical protein